MNVHEHPATQSSRRSALKVSPPPVTLAHEAGEWWTRILKEYEIEDNAGLLLLQTALDAFDRMRQAQGLLAKDGLTVTDRYGQHKQHPAAAIERDNRSQMLMALKQLNLDLEPLRPGPGRPSGT
ncbi:P27 family phage terminase small subunit [Pseudomonadota bacterium]